MRAFLIPCLLVALIVTVLIAVSCNKTSSDKPTLSLESITTTVPVSDSMRVRFKFTGGKAISNNNLWWIRTILNVTPAANPLSGSDTTGYQLPSFSGNTGEIYLSLPWQGALSTGSMRNDTLYFRFYVTNAADSAITDTVITPKIIIDTL
jgi:hypothetical protein